MNSEPKVSVIVSVYNRDKYLKHCLDSIIGQTLQEIEIIIVDDGSTDNSPNICDEYATKDHRIKVIHKKRNEGSGAAANTGMATAVGKYIGFVDSDDWIEPEMYKKLYTTAIEQGVDVVKSLYTEVRAGGGSRVCNKFKQDVWNKKVTNKFQITEFVFGCISHWSAIYRRQFILDGQILHPCFPGASYHDVCFNWQVYVKMRSCYILPLSFYNYNQSNPASAMNQGYKSALLSLDARNWIYEWSIREKLSPQLLMERMKKDTFIMLYYVCLKNEARCKGLNKFVFTLKLSKLLKKCLPGLQFVSFVPWEKKEYLRIANHPLAYALLDFLYEKKSNKSQKYLKILGIKLYERKVKTREICRRILGLPLQKKVEKGSVSKHYFMGIPYRSVERRGDRIIKRIFGVCYKKGTVVETREDRDVRLLQIVTHANAITYTHQKTFTKYKNYHVGEDIALLASGPTLKYFEPFSSCIYVGVNRVCIYSKVEFDYLFFQDFIHCQAREILEAISNYKGAKKFYGILQESIRKDWIVPESAAIRDNAERYYVISQWKYPPIHYPYDIANEPLGDCGSVSFAAMQFILWTNPRRVYLVGQDNSQTYWDGSPTAISSRAVSCQFRGWQEMAKFAKIYYPDTEVISVNPVGLKGMFRDMYTRSYLAEHSEIKVDEEDIFPNE